MDKQQFINWVYDKTFEDLDRWSSGGFTYYRDFMVNNYPDNEELTKLTASFVSEILNDTYMAMCEYNYEYNYVHGLMADEYDYEQSDEWQENEI